MGCCNSIGKKQKDENDLIKIVKNCIKKNDSEKIIRIINTQADKEHSLNYLNDVICSINSIKLNAMGYSLYIGRYKTFEALHKLGCSLSHTETLLFNQGISIIQLLCVKGYEELLAYYLPYYSENYVEKVQEKTITIDLSQESYPRYVPKVTYTPVQLAVQKHHLSVIKKIQEYYYKEFSTIPIELDIDHPDDLLGENCALISCRFGNYAIIKYLHQKCRANFLIKNKRGESAIQIAAAGSRMFTRIKYLQIIAYLVDIVNVDLKYNYEETLLLLEDSEIIEYIIKKLKQYGIFTNKNEIEKIPTLPQNSIITEPEFEKNNGKKKFDFANIYSLACINNEDSLGSSISEKNSFISVCENVFK